MELLLLEQLLLLLPLQEGLLPQVFLLLLLRGKLLLLGPLCLLPQILRLPCVNHTTTAKVSATYLQSLVNRILIRGLELRVLWLELSKLRLNRVLRLDGLILRILDLERKRWANLNIRQVDEIVVLGSTRALAAKMLS